jgi:hypothetical protein
MSQVKCDVPLAANSVVSSSAHETRCARPGVRGIIPSRLSKRVSFTRHAITCQDFAIDVSVVKSGNKEGT